MNDPRPISQIFGDPAAHPLILAHLLIQTFGTEWLSWEATVLWKEIEADMPQVLAKTGGLHPVTVSSVNRNKIQALRTMFLTERYWGDWEVFLPVTMGVNGSPPSQGVMEKPAIGELMFSVLVSKTVRPFKFDEEIARFIAAVGLDEGVCYLPSPLEFAQPFVVQARYICPECSNEWDAPAPGGATCPACTGMHATDNPKAFSPKQDGVGPKGVLRLKHDPAPLEEAYKTGVPPAEQSPERPAFDVLLAAKEYLGFWEEMFHWQATALIPAWK